MQCIKVGFTCIRIQQVQEWPMSQVYVTCNIIPNKLCIHRFNKKNVQFLFWKLSHLAITIFVPTTEVNQQEIHWWRWSYSYEAIILQSIFAKLLINRTILFPKTVQEAFHAAHHRYWKQCNHAWFDNNDAYMLPNSYLSEIQPSQLTLYRREN